MSAPAPPSLRRVPLAGPSITQREIDYVLDAVRHGWGTDADGYNRRLRHACADRFGRRHAIDLPSCTSGIHLALAALGVGPGDEVIVPDLTWIASAAPVSYVGATAVFADVDPATWCVSAETLRACLTPRTRAMIVVDLYGGMPDWDAIAALAAAHGVAVIEDAAEAVGAQWRGRAAGGFGDVSVFSFHGSKTITTGEGGVLLTDAGHLHERALFLRDHGRAPGDTSYRNTEVAYKYKMSNLQAALGLAQVERFEELVAQKRRIFDWYRAALANLPLTLNPEPEGVTNGCWLTTAVLDEAVGVDTVGLGAALGELGVETRPFFRPLSSLDAYGGAPEAQAARARNCHAYRLSPRGITLPGATRMTENDVEYVAGALSGALRRA